MGKSSAIRYDPAFLRRLADHAIAHSDDFEATSEQIAALFGCSERTIYAWKGKHPEFKELCDALAHSIDVPVENALYKLATGHEHEEVETIFDIAEDGQTGKARRVRKIKKYYPPNYQAIQLWLSNRKPDDYKVRRENTNTTELKIQTDERADKELAEILAAAERSRQEQSVDHSD